MWIKKKLLELFIEERVKERVEQAIKAELLIAEELLRREMERMKVEISPRLKSAEYKLDHVETATMEMVKQAVKLKREPMVLRLSITDVEAIIDKIQNKKEIKNE